MAQDFAPLYRSIWTDDDFRARSMDAQHIYMMLFSHPDRNSAGVLSLTLKKWTRLASDLSPDRLDDALAELDATEFIVVDDSTEEVLVRSFIRRAKVYTHIRMLAKALREVSEVESSRLRLVMSRELARLPRLALPDNPKMRAEAEAAQRRVDELAEPPSPPDGPGQGDVHPMAHPMADDMAHPIAHPTVTGTGAVVGTGTGTGRPPEQNSSGGASHVSSGSPAKPPLPTNSRPGLTPERQLATTQGVARTADPVADHRPARPGPLYSDRCPEHADVAVPGNCGDCADVRKARAAQPRLSLVPADDTFQRPPWCGDCDQFTRLRETDTGMARCGACHPLAQEAS